MSSNILISVIIPVHNSSKYLNTCIDSIISNIDNTDSVLIYYADGLHYCHQYFKNIDEAKQYMNNNNISTWYVDKYGFTGVDPEKKKIYHRLPYYNILHELSIGEEINIIAWRWNKASNNEDFGTLLILVKAYLAFKRNDELARIQILSEQ